MRARVTREETRSKVTRPGFGGAMVGECGSCGNWDEAIGSEVRREIGTTLESRSRRDEEIKRQGGLVLRRCILDD